ncbi:MAG: minichromosome maintenance protein MCM [Candidatus Woesearchaeota archaeon]
MEESEQVAKFQNFFEHYYYAELLEKIRKKEKFITLDFALLSEFDPALADLLLEKPDEVLQTARLAIEQFDSQGDAKDFTCRFKNISSSQKIMVRNIRSSHLGKLLWMVGIVRQKSDVRPQVTSSKFECPVCGAIINVLQLDTKFKEPSKCSCGRKGRFHLLSKELVDVQSLTLEEATEELEGGEQPKRIKIFLKNDLVSPLSEKHTNPGTKIIVVGQVKEVPITLKSGGQSTRFDILIEANHIEASQEEFLDLNVLPEELEQIRELSEDPKLYSRLVQSIAPSIYGHEVIKEALLYQLMGGVRKSREGGAVTRGDIHVLLIGDPGSGKSQLLKRITNVAPKARYVSGKGTTGAGLTASVVRDEFLQGYSLEAGALVLANHGLCAIDELDKMSKEDRSAMHEGLEQQSVSIAKANIQATLTCETTVLAAANPKFGRFDPYGNIAEQIDLPSTLINRFDLIFPIKDLPDEDKDKKMARFILNLHQNPYVEEPEISTNLLRKYIAYAKQNLKPRLTEAAVEEIELYYLKMRASGSIEGAVKSIPISPRQLEGLIRLSEAAARVRLSDKVTKKDARRAINLLDYCLRQIALDEETGTIDIDRIATGITATQRTRIVSIKEIIVELENKLGKTIPIEDIMRLATEKGMDESDVESAIEKLKRSGDIYEPRHGIISRL